MALTCEWRGRFNNAEVNALHAEAFDHRLLDDDWNGQVRRHSLGWVCARNKDELVGFVNVAWDGGAHAFILDAIVKISARGQAVGAQLVAVAVEGARRGVANGSMSILTTISETSTFKLVGSRQQTPA
jgi:hypothetical protein